jgi:phosphoribosylanthranilate isomerase
MLRTIVKISGVTNLSDARYCAGMGVTMLGFGMDADAPNYVDPARCAEIRGWVSGVQIVGETAATDPDHIARLVDAYQPDLVQVGHAGLLPVLGKPLILRLDLAVTTPEELDTLTLPVKPDYLLLDGPDSLSLGPGLLHSLLLLSMNQTVLLGTGLTMDNLQTLLDTVPIKGIALSGGREDRPGQRDFGLLMDILEALETEV